MSQDSLKKLRADLALVVQDLHDVREVLVLMTPPDNAKIIAANAQDSVQRIMRATLKFPLLEYQVGDVRPDGATLIQDATGLRTWQFPNAPTGPVVERPPASTPAVPKEYGVGALVDFQAQISRVLRVGDGVILVDRGGSDPIWLYPRDVTLVTAAPV